MNCIFIFTESKGYYLKWVHTCFEMLIDLVHSEVGSGNTNQGAGADEVNRLQVVFFFLNRFLFFILLYY